MTDTQPSDRTHERDAATDGTCRVVTPVVQLARCGSVEKNAGRRRQDPVAQLFEDTELIFGPHAPQARLLFLLCVSRYAGMPASATLVGPSSVGKSYVATHVAQMLPSEDTKCLLDATYAAMTAGFGCVALRDSAGNRVVDLRGIALFMDEHTAIIDPTVRACLRQLTTSEWTERTKIEAGRPTTTRLRGPITLVECQLASREVDYQSANRHVQIMLSPDEDALAAVVARTASAPTMAGQRQADQVREASADWRSFLRELDHDLRVVIEFAGQIVPRLCGWPGGQPTHGSRFLRAVQSAISSIAWLRQPQRQRVKLGTGVEAILATRDDYRVAIEVLQRGNVADERPAIPAPAMHLFTRWQALSTDQGDQPYTARAIYHRIGMTVDRGNMTRHLQPLVAAELVVELPQRNANRQKLYQLSSVGLRASAANMLSTLPPPDALQITEEGGADAKD